MNVYFYTVQEKKKKKFEFKIPKQNFKIYIK